MMAPKKGNVTRGVHKSDREPGRGAGVRSVASAVASTAPSSEAACARVVCLRRRLSPVRTRAATRGQRWLEGTRARPASARAGDPAAGYAAAAADRTRPAGTGGAESGAASSVVARVPRYTGDAAALAPTDHRAPLDLPAPAARATAAGQGGARAHPAARAREQPLGLCSDRRRVAQARDHRLGDAGAKPCSPAPASRRRRNATSSAGARSSGSTLRRCWPAISSPVDTVWLRRLYVLFFVSIGTRRVEYLACTSNPNATWMAQQARNVLMDLDERGQRPRFLIHDRDTKFSRAFDGIFQSEDIAVIRTPIRAPNANAYAERWVGSVRRECLDRLLIFGRRQLEHGLRVYVCHFNQRRPHRGLELRPPDSRGGLDPPRAVTARIPQVRRRNLLGGLLHEYELAA